jgi:hypothetical protein
MQNISRRCLLKLRTQNSYYDLLSYGRFFLLSRRFSVPLSFLLMRGDVCEAKTDDIREDAVRSVNDRARCAVKLRGFEAAGEQALLPPHVGAV